MFESGCHDACATDRGSGGWERVACDGVDPWCVVPRSPSSPFLPEVMDRARPMNCADQHRRLSNSDVWECSAGVVWYVLYLYLISHPSNQIEFITYLIMPQDSTNLVRTSVEKKQPMIVVTLNYRLNIFAFGNGSGAKNLALSDQRAALDFVKKHIGEFGGDAVCTVYVYAFLLITR